MGYGSWGGPIGGAAFMGGIRRGGYGGSGSNNEDDNKGPEDDFNMKGFVIFVIIIGIIGIILSL